MLIGDLTVRESLRAALRLKTYGNRDTVKHRRLFAGPLAASPSLSPATAGIISLQHPPLFTSHACTAAAVSRAMRPSIRC
jgi:hypothetical protein